MVVIIIRHIHTTVIRNRLRPSFGDVVCRDVLLRSDGIGLLLPILFITSRSTMDCLSGMDD